jgi:hypothetical protein
MSRQEHSDDCPGCEPAMLDRTGKRVPDDAPEMQVVLKLWKETTSEERKAWHSVTCKNSREPADLSLAGGFVERIQKGLLELKKRTGIT